jgi:hypothetical protein
MDLVFGTLKVGFKWISISDVSLNSQGSVVELVVKLII